MTGYKTRTAGTARPVRDITKEVPLGILEPEQWHNVTIDGISMSSTSAVIKVSDQYDNKLDTRIFLREFRDHTQVSQKLRAFLSAATKNSAELMQIMDDLLDGEFHAIGVLAGRSVKCKVGYNGPDIDIVQFNRAGINKPQTRSLSFLEG